MSPGKKSKRSKKAPLKEEPCEGGCQCPTCTEREVFDAVLNLFGAFKDRMITPHGIIGVMGTVQHLIRDSVLEAWEDDDKAFEKHIEKLRKG
jgi:hypothetical protein